MGMSISLWREKDKKSLSSAPARFPNLTKSNNFRAEKLSAQASAHLLSQAQGGLFCVLTVFDPVRPCLFVTERVLAETE